MDNPEEKNDLNTITTCNKEPAKKIKPFLEKSNSRARSGAKWGFLRDFSWTRKTILIVAGLVFVLTVCLGLYFVFKPSYKEASHVPYATLVYPNIQSETFFHFSDDLEPSERVISLFLSNESGADNLQVIPKLKLDHKESDNVATPFVLRDAGEPGRFFDQELLARLYIAKGDYNNLVRVLETIKVKYHDLLGTEANLSFWPEQLKHLRTLLIARQKWESTYLNQEIENYSEVLFRAFSDGIFPTETRTFDNPVYPQVSGVDVEKERFSEEYDLSVILLENLDLWVLQSLSSIEPRWLEPYEICKSLLENACLDNGFFAYAWDTTKEVYIPVAGTPFSSEPVSTLKQIISLYEIGEGNADYILELNQLLLRDRGLYSSYHSASLVPMSEGKSLEGLLLMKRLGKLAGQELSDTIASQLLNTHLGTSQIPILEGLVLSTSDKDITLDFCHNALFILLNVEN